MRFPEGPGVLSGGGAGDKITIPLRVTDGGSAGRAEHANAGKYRRSRLGFRKPVGLKEEAADRGRMRIGRAYIECYIGHKQKMNDMERRGGGNEREYLGGESSTRQGCPAAMAIAGGRAERGSQAISARFRKRGGGRWANPWKHGDAKPQGLRHFGGCGSSGTIDPLWCIRAAGIWQEQLCQPGR